LTKEYGHTPDGKPLPYTLTFTGPSDADQLHQAKVLLNNGSAAVCVSNVQESATLQTILYLFRREHIYANARRIFFFE
jgi:hypothetical protein